MAALRAAIVGCANRSHGHASAYRLVPEARLVACCDHNAEQATAFAERHGLKAYRDAEEMIVAERPDIVHLVTRPARRVEQLTQLSELGVPACIVEKPIATQVADWHALQTLAAHTSMKVAVGAQWRYSPLLGHCRAVLESGELGAPLFMEATAGLPMCDQGVHVLDWAMSLNGELPAVEVFGAAAGAGELDTKHPSPVSTTAQLRFANDLTCLWVLGDAAPRVRIGYAEAARFMHCRVAVYCERGRLLFEEFGGWAVVGPRRDERGTTASWAEWTEHNDQAQAALTRGVGGWLAGGPAVGTQLNNALSQWNTVLGLYASEVWGRPVALPCDPPESLFAELSSLLRGREQTGKDS